MLRISMDTRKAFARALKEIRLARGLTQEDFSDVSSRTYMSTLERELKSPTLDKIDELASVLKIHPLTLLTMAYANKKQGDALKAFLTKITAEIQEVRSFTNE